MQKSERIEDFYKNKLDWIPDSFHKGIGHFNVFRLEPYVGAGAKPVPYSRRSYFKISLIKGNSRVHYADKVVEIQRQALLFANPQVAYNWEGLEKIQSGAFCVFTPSFFYQTGSLSQFSVFQPGGTPLFELTDVQANRVEDIFERMFEEINSDYRFKYDALRNLVLELLHYAMKLEPAERLSQQDGHASQRIAALFLELLERQFPIDDTRQRLALRSASDFSAHMSIHVNHLNRALKATTTKSTTVIIAERILQEAKILLKHSSWNISEIAHVLGFTEATHFNNFFKKHTQLSPTAFRNI